MKKIKTFLLILVCLFSFATLVACGEEENNQNDNTQQTPGENDNKTPEQTPDNGGNNDDEKTPVGSTIDVSGVTLEESYTFEYTGKPLAVMPENLPEGVKVKFTYTCEGEEVTEMVKKGVYEIVAVVIDKATGEELKTLTSTLTIAPKTEVDELPNDLEEKLQLTYTTHYSNFIQNPDDATQLIAAGLELMTSENIYIVIEGKDEPLNFLRLDEESVECAYIEENYLVISEAGTYDVILYLAEGDFVPTLLVREGADSSQFYLRGTMNDYAASEEYLFVIDEATNTASYEIELAVGDVFKIANYYYSVAYDYNPYFMYLAGFAMGGEFNTDVKVSVAGMYKFVINLQNKVLTVYRDNVELVEDRDILFLRGEMNNYDLSLPFSKEDGVLTIEYAFEVNDVFAIGNADWSSQYAYNPFFSGMTEYFTAGGGYGTDIKVLVAGNYKLVVTPAEGKVVVYKDGNEIGTGTGSSSGGSQGTASYALIITHADGTQTMVNLTPVDEFEGFSQHFGDNVQLTEGDVITLYDVNNKVSWAEDTLSPYGQYKNFLAGSNGITCKVSGTYDFYVKFKWEADEIYIGNENGA